MLFALNRRYLINEKGALLETARLPMTIPHLVEQFDENLANHRRRRFRAGLRDPAAIRPTVEDADATRRDTAVNG
ncbi:MULTISPECIES: hypothetical protein [Bradyrhizobium]|uniref:hypothetical protein n=1 Tax=Bradyrhizobium TaxID=374 RepID=UPI0004B9882A|nr:MULTISPECIES: hypothetical protein [unclassified Bradyrhizobium]MDA9427017.1 hypothetical protein [Bradyrhizobium sp. CCBAU 53380]